MDSNERLQLAVGERKQLPFDISEAGPGIYSYKYHYFSKFSCQKYVAQTVKAQIRLLLVEQSDKGPQYLLSIMYASFGGTYFLYYKANLCDL